MTNFHALNQQIIYPHIQDLCEQISTYKHDLYLDGSLAFPMDEKFLPGTISSSFCYLLTSLDKNSDDFKSWSYKTTQMLAHNSTLSVSTFGILEFLSALYELYKNDLLESIVSTEVLDILKQKLDWHVFVDETTWTLKNGLPTNYFGVAFRVALLREQLGWDTEEISTKFLDILITHIVTHSGKYLYMDETNGEGRYDKYTVSIAAELCELLVEFNKPIPDTLYQVMQKCCDILIQMLDVHGNGFCYGRSIGSHGEAVIIETFPVAARMGIFSSEDLPFIYTATYHAAHKIATFWFNKARGGFNIWDDGRRTDHYRGKTRVLEVNLDMSLKMIRAENHLKALGLNQLDILHTESYASKLATLPDFRYFCFENETYERGLLVVRTPWHVFSLPLINGGHKHYAHIPYIPLPFSIGVIEGTPEEVRPTLVPKLTLQDGIEVMPIAYMKDVVVDEAAHTISFKQDVCCNLKDEVYPEACEGISCLTTYTFDQNQITRTDTFNLNNTLSALKVELELDTFSTLDKKDTHSVSLNEGSITHFSVIGMDIESITNVVGNYNYDTPHGSHKLNIKCSGTPTGNTFTTSWSINYL